MQKIFLEEYFRKELARAEFGEMEYSSSTTQGIKIVLKVGRVGYAIGKKGKTIKKLSEDVKNMLKTEKVAIEVDSLKDAELNPWVMAEKLASALQRGRHFRRTAYGTVRRIMGRGAVGVEITVAGKITSQRARVEKFREGFIAKTGDPKRKFLKIGRAIAKIKRGTLGITVAIMDPETILPDNINIIAEPTHTSKEIDISSDEDLISIEPGMEDDEQLVEGIDEGELPPLEEEGVELPEDAAEPLLEEGEELELDDLDDELDLGDDETTTEDE